MGNMEARYRNNRSIPWEECDIIEDPRDWLNYHLVLNRDETMEKYNGLTDEQKQQIHDCWEDGMGA